ncbi:MAG: hypothetical protein AABX69_01485 [Nanoarchaeota archaeon]
MNGRKRTFGELRHIILTALLSGQQTTNQISVRTGINWRTVEAHLTHLIGKGFVTEVLKSEYVRIFKLSDAGLQHASGLVQQHQEAAVKMGKIEKEKMVDA